MPRPGRRKRRPYEAAGSGGGGCIAAPGSGRGCGLSAGFFSGGIPAVLGTTLDVTYVNGSAVGVSDPLVVQATNELIQAINLVDPLDPLSEGPEDAIASTFKEQTDQAADDPGGTGAQRSDKPKECR